MHDCAASHIRHKAEESEESYVLGFGAAMGRGRSPRQEPVQSVIGSRRRLSSRDRDFVGWSALMFDAASWIWHHGLMYFEIVSDISQVKTFATGSGIREIGRLRKLYGRGNWRKRKGVAYVRLSDGTVALAEVHWYEAHGLGRFEFKIKRFL